MTATLSYPSRHAAHPPATYQRRRAVVGAVLAVAVLAVMVAASTVTVHDVLAGSGGVPASAASSQPALVRAQVTARQGDTLWSLAAAHRGDISMARYVEKLIDLNGGAAIQAGQSVTLP